MSLDKWETFLLPFTNCRISRKLREIFVKIKSTIFPSLFFEMIFHFHRVDIRILDLSLSRKKKKKKRFDQSRENERGEKIDAIQISNSSLAHLQTESDEGARRGETRKGKHILPSGREPPRGPIPLDLQQFRREYRRGRQSYRQGGHILHRLVHTYDGIGLRHVALLGHQSNWTSTSALRLSHHTGRWGIFTVIIHNHGNSAVKLLVIFANYSRLLFIVSKRDEEILMKKKTRIIPFQTFNLDNLLAHLSDQKIYQIRPAR